MKSPFIQIIFIGVAVTANLILHAQNRSDFEERVFNQYEAGQASAYDLLYAIDYDEVLYKKGKKRIEDFVDGLKQKGIQSKSIKKQIQTIYKSTHSRFFSRYKEESYFPEIFYDGTYNCVTATAMYALIFDEFGINYSIRETPNHVYMIADTLREQMLIESTAPDLGAITFNQKRKKEFASYLNANKIISDREYGTLTTEQLFNKYYSSDKSISVSELAALQYYNKGIFLSIDEKYADAAQYFQKAMKVYPSNSIKFNQFASLQNALYDDFHQKKYNGKLYAQLFESGIKDSSTLQLVSDYFHNISLELCTKTPDMERYEKFYEDMTAGVSMKDLPTGILSNYHSFRGYNYGLNGSYPLAISEVKKAYQYNREDLRLKDMALEFCSRHLFLDRNYKGQIDSMERYFAQLPFLLENGNFQQQYVYYYMKVMGNGYQYDNPEEAKRYYIRFTEALENYNIEHYSEDHIGYGFGNMAVYHANRQEYSKALEAIENGLELVPESPQLKQTKSEVVKDQRSYSNYLASQSSRSVSTDAYVDPREVEREAFKSKVLKHFPGKWKAVSILIEDMEQDLTAKESFEFDAATSKNCSYTNNGKTETGKWAYRKISKCIYFVPSDDKDAYMVFRVKSVTSDEIVLLPYKDQKRPSPYYYVLKRID